MDKRIVFHDAEKAVFRSMMRKLERFCGVRICTYCFMGNHFHLLVEVPERDSIAPLTEDTLPEFLSLLYDRATVESVMARIELARRSGNEAWIRDTIAGYEGRRGDLSVFLKELKQRISIFLNRRLGRVGTLWEGRFKSVLVEGGEEALLAVAAYIDLNPVRAGLVETPEAYRWSGYGEAMGTGKGGKQARAGLASIQKEQLDRPPGEPIETASWRSVGDRYRRLLYLEGIERNGDLDTGAGRRRGIAVETAEAVLERDRPLCLPEVLRRKVRYFSDGAILGSACFVETAFEALCDDGRIGRKRKTGARRLRGADWGNLRVLRDLQTRVMGPGSDPGS